MATRAARLPLPAAARVPGSVVPFGTVGDRSAYDFADGLTLHVSGLQSSPAVDVTVPALDGLPAATLSVTRDDVVLTAETR